MSKPSMSLLPPAERLDAAADVIAEVAKPVEIAKPAGKSAPRGKKAKAPAMPWDGLSPTTTRQYNVDLPADLHAQLKWLGDTTAGTSMRQLVIGALRAFADAELAKQ